jgi:hypothetical protein
VFGTNIAQSIGLSQTPPLSQLMKLALLCVLVGAVGLVRRSPRWASILMIPFALTLLAAAVHVYPLSLRTELFLTPSIILLLTAGVADLVRWTPLRWRMSIAGVLTVALAAGPIYLAGSRLIHPRHVEEIRPVLEFVRDHWKAGDTLYLHDEAQYAFLYYEKCKCLRLSHDGRRLWPVRSLSGVDFRAQAIESTTPTLIVVSDLPRYVADLRKQKGRRRIWFLYTHVANRQDEEAIRRAVRTLGDVAVRLNGIDRRRAHAYVYELRNP